MHVFSGKDRKWTVVLERGEEVLSSLNKFAKEHGIRSGSVTGIGALDQVELGFFHLNTQEYARKHFGAQEFELISLTGNISLIEGEPFTHAHMQLADEEFRCLGGHLFSAKVAVTCELSVVDYGTEMHRQFDESIGLNLIKP